MKNVWCCFIVIAAILCFCSGVFGETRYTFTDLGSFGGDITTAAAINNKGQITGAATLPGGWPSHAFIYDNGQMTDLGFSGGGNSINDSGQIAGISGQSAVVYSNGTTTNISTSQSEAYAINNNGQTVGRYTNANKARAFSYSNGVMTDLGTLGGTQAYAKSINDSGQITGFSYTTLDYTAHAFLYSNGIMTDLNIGQALSASMAINNNQQVIGYFVFDPYSPSNYEHAFLYENGTTHDLGTLGGNQSWAWAINELGQVVGSSEIGGTTHAFIYSNNAMLDLNNLIDPGLGLTLTEAKGINDSGQICGTATDSVGFVHGFLLTPTPEPATIALLALGGLILRKRKG